MLFCEECVIADCREVTLFSGKACTHSQLSELGADCLICTLLSARIATRRQIDVDLARRSLS